MNFFSKLFDTSDFPPRWTCGNWSSEHGWLHIVSDLGVWAAYVAIPCVLGYFVVRKKEVPFRAIFALFGAFILACGTTHLMEAVIFWWPAYRLAGLIKLFTAVVSWATLIALVPIVPKALAMRSSEELKREISERKRAEEALRLANIRLQLAVGGNGPPTPQPARVQPAAVAPLRILVAEDNEFNTRHVERLLSRSGHQVRLAANGREALVSLGIDEQAAAGPTSSALDFDLLLLDLHMPELDGFQVIHALREWEKKTGGHLPVIALTARARKEDCDRCLAAGMDDYLSKPVRTAELFAAIERLGAARKVVRHAAADAGGRVDLLDPVTLLAACGDDAEGLRELCKDFHAFAPARFAEVGEAMRVRDAPRLREAAHKLYGLLSAFSTLAGKLASDLEDQAASGQLGEAQPLVERLEKIAPELFRQVDGVSLESLRRQGEMANKLRQPGDPSHSEMGF